MKAWLWSSILIHFFFAASRSMRISSIFLTYTLSGSFMCFFLPCSSPSHNLLVLITCFQLQKMRVLGWPLLERTCQAVVATDDLWQKGRPIDHADMFLWWNRVFVRLADGLHHIWAPTFFPVLQDDAAKLVLLQEVTRKSLHCTKKLQYVTGEFFRNSS